MLYIVECSYNDAESEDEWNFFYSQQKLPALISVTGFKTSQRLRANKEGYPAYLAIHTIDNTKVLNSEDYHLKGGGNFSRWQKNISDWHRNLYETEGIAPAILADQRLVISTNKIDFSALATRFSGMELYAVGLEKHPEYRVIYSVPVEIAKLFIEIESVSVYEPMTQQLQSLIT